MRRTIYNEKEEQERSQNITKTKEQGECNTDRMGRTRDETGQSETRNGGRTKENEGREGKGSRRGGG